jgi:hypothetical protein
MFVYGRNGKPDLYAIEADGSNVRRFVNSGFEEERRIYAESGHG